MKAASYRTQAQAQLVEGNYDEARLLVQRAIALDDQDGNTIGRAMNISLLGDIEGQANNLQAAGTAFEDAIALFESAGDRHNAAISYHQWAKAFLGNDAWEEAGLYFIHSARIFSEEDDHATLVTVAQNFRYYLDQLMVDSATSMALQWVSAGLPASEVHGYLDEGQLIEFLSKFEPEGPDDDDTSSRPN